MDDYLMMKKAEALHKAEIKRAEWEAKVKTKRMEIADELDRRGANSLNIGKWRITRTSYQREQLDVNALRTLAPEAYAKCCKPCKVSRLTVTM